MRVLVVDDNSFFREELASFLRDDGHSASPAPSVAAALEILKREEFEVVVTDLKMPHQSGLELVARN